MKRIGLTASELENKGKTKIKSTYLNYVRGNGYRAIILDTPKTKKQAKEIIKDLDGIIFTGGCDINPKYYNEETLDCCGAVSEIRDKSELLLLEVAIELNKPIMGICRGFQLINVYFGGNLYQDIETQYKKDIVHRTIDFKEAVLHDIYIKDDLFKMNKEIERVNSYHHQGIKKLSKELIVGAISEDGLVEAYYHKNKNIIAVQWHPERMLDNKYSSYIFDMFINKK